MQIIWSKIPIVMLHREDFRDHLQMRVIVRQKILAHEWHPQPGSHPLHVYWEDLQMQAVEPDLIR